MNIPTSLIKSIPTSREVNTLDNPWFFAAILVGTPDGLMPQTVAVPPGKDARHRACVVAYLIARYQTEGKEHE